MFRINSTADKINIIKDIKTKDKLFRDKDINKNIIYKITQTNSIINMYTIKVQTLTTKKNIKNQNKKLNNKKSFNI
jgi:hypothetical protein